MKIRRTFHDWMLTPHRLALHLPTKTAVIADVHLGYAEARQRKGDAVPLTESQTLHEDLTQAWRAQPFARLVVAGDLFERRADADLLAPLLSWCRLHDVEFLGLTPGNHDRGLENVPELRIWPEGFEVGRWRIVHEPGTITDSWVCGHFHPCLRIQGRKIPCYVIGANRLILPAFSRDAAGVEVTALGLEKGFTVVPAVEVPPMKPAAGQLLRALHERRR